MAAESDLMQVMRMDGTRLSDLIAPVYFSVHRDLKNRKNDEYFFSGGRGSAKSSFISLEIIMGMLRDPEANAIIYRRVGNTLRESVYEQIQWAINMLGVAEYFKTQISPMEIRHKRTGQRIMFRGADDPGKSKSIKIGKGYFKYLWFEEAADFQGMEAIRTIKISVVRGHDGRAITFLSYNPPISARNWINAEVLKSKPGRLVHRSCYLDIPKRWLGEAFINEAEALKASNDRAYRHTYLGEVTGTGLNVFENLSVREISAEEISQFGSTYAGMDFGWYPDPLHFVRCAYEPARRRLWIYDEYRTLKTKNAEVYRQLVEKHGLTWEDEVIADSQEQKSISDFREMGMQCVGAMKGPGSVSTGIKWLQALNEIIIDPQRCPATAKEFTEYEYEKDREGNAVAVYPDKDNHGIDAVRYAMNREWKRKGS